MANRSGRIGTDGENGLRDYLRVNGWPHAERLRPEGEHDRGDITGTPGITWQMKAGQTAYDASVDQVATWLRDTEAQQVRAHSDYGILVLRRYRVPPARAGEWWAVMRGTDAIHLAMAHNLVDAITAFDCPMWLLLDDVIGALRQAGYGTPRKQVVAAAVAATPTGDGTT